jgi:hypothetical protein
VRQPFDAEPTAIRRFSPADLITAFAEVYSSDDRVSEEDITVTATIGTPGGGRMKEEPARLSRRESFTGAVPVRWGANFELSLADVPPGRYVLTVSAVETRTRGVAQRQVPFVVED